MGRPRGAKDKIPRAPRADRTVQVSAREQALLQALEATAPLTTDELLERGRALKGALPPEHNGAAGSQYKHLGITPTHAERAALAYRLMIRGLTIAQIAEQLKVSPDTARAQVQMVEKMLRLDPKKLDVGYYMGESLQFYQEVRQMALLQSSSASNSTSAKLFAMRVALQAEQDKNQFLTQIGVYSPSVISRVESWITAIAADQLLGAPEAQPRVNLAAELGKVLASRFKRALGEQPSD